MNSAKEIKAILLAAGLGARLRPLTDILPKCLMPVNGRPLLEYWLRDLTAAGIEDILINTHYLAVLVRKWLTKSEYGSRTTISHEEEMLGTGGTILHNRNFIGHNPALIIHADNLCRADLHSFFKARQKRPANCVITMMTFASENPQNCGIV